MRVPADPGRQREPGLEVVERDWPQVVALVAEVEPDADPPVVQDPALLGQVDLGDPVVEFRQAGDLRDGDQVGSPETLAFLLDSAFLVRFLAGDAVERVEPVFSELPGQVTGRSVCAALMHSRSRFVPLSGWLATQTRLLRPLPVPAEPRWDRRRLKAPSRDDLLSGRHIALRPTPSRDSKILDSRHWICLAPLDCACVFDRLHPTSSARQRWSPVPQTHQACLQAP
ncbi:hypothetical protein BCF44_101218 [Kutzneria buriramensis]|uniref:Uncharacterized protein n=1 Tax=Kutzneria buriramensis TaxID=1045776 RepID=A0A3E0I9B5_9PSEU|nr:hypothetical protein BCF44_101218 [Kutzneria buriramensis]